MTIRTIPSNTLAIGTVFTLGGYDTSRRQIVTWVTDEGVVTYVPDGSGDVPPKRIVKPRDVQIEGRVKYHPPVREARVLTQRPRNLLDIRKRKAARRKQKHVAAAAQRAQKAGE